jgi:site-specific recombinase XerD
MDPHRIGSNLTRRWSIFGRTAPSSSRHSLASFLVRKGTDVKTVQKMLRHSDVATTLGIYAHSMSEDRLAAQDDMLAAMMTPSNPVN